MLDDLFRHLGQDRRLDESGADRVGADALAAQFARPRLDHADDAELGRRVIGLAEVAVDADDRRCVEDAARILREHDVDDGLGAVVDALQVDVDDAVELVLAHLLELRVLDDAGVVDQRVDAPPLGHHALDHRRDAFLVGDVDDEADGLAAALDDEIDRRLHRGLVDVAGDDLRAFLGELDGGRLANALAGTGDDCDVIEQAHGCVLRWVLLGLANSGSPDPGDYSRFDAVHN